MPASRFRMRVRWHGRHLSSKINNLREHQQTEHCAFVLRRTNYLHTRCTTYAILTVAQQAAVVYPLAMFKQIVHWLVAIAVVLNVISFLTTCQLHMPEISPYLGG